MGLQVEDTEPLRWRPCEAEEKNMKEGGRKEQKMRREEEVKEGRGVEEGGREEKKKKGRETSAALQRAGMLKVSIC